MQLLILFYLPIWSVMLMKRCENMESCKSKRKQDDSKDEDGDEAESKDIFVTDIYAHLYSIISITTIIIIS